MASRYCLKENPDLLEEAVREAAYALRSGGIVLFPTETVYGVGCDAMNPEAVRRLYERKRRPADKALLLHLHSVEQAEAVSVLSEKAKRLLRAFCPGPLSLIVPKRDILPDAVTAGMDTVGLRFPSNPVFLAVSQAFGGWIAATSANRSGSPSAKDSGDLKDAEEIADVILDAGPCRYSFESTVLSLIEDPPVILRQGVVTEKQIREVAEW
ncbi:MAG: threonylcarbamoyl-AMP synthase [Clostridia bacterium]|nr:threonylcarbamoyl-AMP synthase [Clostridia bacterium]